VVGSPFPTSSGKRYTHELKFCAMMQLNETERYPTQQHRTEPDKTKFLLLLPSQYGKESTFSALYRTPQDDTRRHGTAPNKTKFLLLLPSQYGRGVLFLHHIRHHITGLLPNQTKQNSYFPCSRSMAKGVPVLTVTSRDSTAPNKTKSLLPLPSQYGRGSSFLHRIQRHATLPY